MQVKQGVKLHGIQLSMRPVLIHADRIWKEHGQELVITSTTEGVHSPRSLHPFGYALDLRTRYFDKPTQHLVESKLLIELKKLSRHYDTVLHDTHIHVEYYDPLIEVLYGENKINESKKPQK